MQHDDHNTASDKHYTITMLQLQQCCDRYNQTQSLDPVDYADYVGPAAEYVVTLLDAFNQQK